MVSKQKQQEASASNSSMRQAEFKRYAQRSFLQQLGTILGGFVLAILLASIFYILNPNFPLFRGELVVALEFPLIFASLTLSMLHPSAPIFGLFLRYYYGVVFFVSLLCALAWTAFGLYMVFGVTRGDGVMHWLLFFVYTTCAVIPVCYCFAWRLNKKYWMKKDSLEEEIMQGTRALTGRT